MASKFSMSFNNFSICGLSLQNNTQLKESLDGALNYLSTRPVLQYTLIGVSSFYIFKTVFSSTVREKFFAKLMNYIATNDTKQSQEYKEIKKTFFSPLQQMKSSPESPIKILEIGIGVGTNFEYYPEGTHLIVVDPNPHFQKYYSKNKSEFKHIKSEEFVLTLGEEMYMVASDSVDVVVATQVLCSVLDEEKIFEQIMRVLKPGAKFYFIDHVLEWNYRDHSWRRFCQFLFTCIGIWPFMFCNCNMNRNPIPTLNAMGFTHIEFTYFYAPLHWILDWTKPRVRGIATK